ncbi:MAG: LysR family transcriptional regulator, partial [Planctomycetes bacterium]|nr:LysR family transcriptional regulator [Planctomycetota bacterium]
MVAAEAKRRRFFEAKRRAFLGDGLAWNWTLQKRYFPDFEPIVDFVHPMTYIFEASRVVDSQGDGWNLCERPLEASWQGNVMSVLEELRRWQTLHPSPSDEKLAKTDGRSIVARTVTYLSNNQSR